MAAAGRPIGLETQARNEKHRAVSTAHDTQRRIPAIQARFPNISLASHHENPGELRRIRGGKPPRVAVIQHPDILTPALDWQKRNHTGGGIPVGGHNEAHPPQQRVGIINAADEVDPAGGQNQATQEHAIARRSTLKKNLTTPALNERKQTFYPLENGGIYSPNVIVIRDGPDNDYKLYEEAEEYSVISVISVPPERTPMLDNDGFYLFEMERDLQRSRMVTALRIAANHGHRDIIIGSFGSVNREVPEYTTRRHNRGAGVHGQGPVNDERRDINPIREVASMWADLLDNDESEFMGYFDNVLFITGIGQRAIEDANALCNAFKLPQVGRLLRQWYPGEYDHVFASSSGNN